MNIGLIILIVLFVVFILLLVFNPSLSCFGKRIRSPFYPLYRRRLIAAKGKKDLKTSDYGFHLVEAEERKNEALSTERPSKKEPTGVEKSKKTEDYGFKLD
ncbi:MAG: hypothetical protein N3B16_00980 [Candidatus Aminicenantes bacterium]|nr:hypothetical protein [Candidatus Aminicenantes bacterium]